MQVEYLEIYRKLDFLPDYLRLQYTNFIKRHYKKLPYKSNLEHITARLKTNEPLEYIFNTAEFCALEFYVDKRVLIPRVETEKIVFLAFEYIRILKENFTVVDVGTGSGCIILSLAWILDNSNIYNKEKVKLIGIEKYFPAYEVAKINRKRLGLESKVELINIDFEHFNFERHENLIVLANLPYIPNSRKLQPSVANFEPKEALFGGKKGDELITKLKQKLGKLKNIKLLILEKDNGVVEKIEFNIDNC